MIRVLVTGSNGQLGRTLQDQAIQYTEVDFYFTTKDTLDITKPQEVSQIFNKLQPQYCINCAAYTNVEQAEKTSKIAYDVNAEGVKNVALACLDNRVKLIHISTDYVFDGEKEEGYYPDDEPNPINEYGKSKLKGEEYIQEILKEHLIIRTSWLYSDYGNNFYKSILSNAKKGKDLVVTEAEKGCPTHATNLARYICCLISKKKMSYGVSHFTDKILMTRLEFAKEIIKKSELNNNVIPRKENKKTSVVKRPKCVWLIN